jgi:hypothetical protein
MPLKSESKKNDSHYFQQAILYLKMHFKENPTLKETADAKELIKKMLYEYQRLCLIKKETIAEAERFLIEPNDRFEVTKKGKEYLSSH